MVLQSVTERKDSKARALHRASYGQEHAPRVVDRQHSKMQGPTKSAEWRKDLKQAKESEEKRKTKKKYFPERCCLQGSNLWPNPSTILIDKCKGFALPLS